MKRLIFAVLALTLTVVVSAAASETVTITLKDVAEVKGETVLVGDVAEVNAALPEVAGLIAGLRVADAPAINGSTKITPEAVRAALARLPLDMSAIAVEGARNTVVSRKGQAIGPEDLKAAVRAHVVEHTGLPDDDVLCDFVHTPRAFAVAVGEVTYAVVPVANAPYTGYQAFTVYVRVDGIEAVSERVTVRIRLFRPVAVTRRRLGRDEVITEQDVTLERREVTSSIGNYFTQAADVVGKRATRSVSAGVVLTDVVVGEPLAVRRNDAVTLVARRGYVRVRTKVIVLKDACVGESVDVMNGDSKKIIRARVVGPNLVELSL